MLSTRVFLPLMATIFLVVKADVADFTREQLSLQVKTQSELSYRIFNVNADEAIAKLEARTDVVIYDCSMGPSGPICTPRGIRRRLGKKDKKNMNHKKQGKKKKKSQVPAHDMVALTKNLVASAVTSTHGECFAVASMFSTAGIGGPQWVIASFLSCEAVMYVASIFKNSGDAQSKALEAQANLETEKLAAEVEREKLVYQRKKDEIKRNDDLKRNERTAKLAQEQLKYDHKQAELKRQDKLNKREYKRKQKELKRQDTLDKLKYEREQAQTKGLNLTQGFMTCMTENEDLLSDLKLKVKVEKVIRHCQIQEALKLTPVAPEWINTDPSTAEDSESESESE